MIQKTNRGFTLVELLVVISIISLLSSIVLSSLSSARLKARNSVKIQTREEVKKALALFYADKGYYPESAGALIPNYISTINPNSIGYRGVDCDSNQCRDYGIWVNLEDPNNPSGNNNSPVYKYIAIGGDSSLGSPTGGYVYNGGWSYTNYYTYYNGQTTWILFNNGRAWFISEKLGGGVAQWNGGVGIPGNYQPYSQYTNATGVVTVSTP